MGEGATKHTVSENNRLFMRDMLMDGVSSLTLQEENILDTLSSLADWHDQMVVRHTKAGRIGDATIHMVSASGIRMWLVKRGALE